MKLSHLYIIALFAFALNSCQSPEGKTIKIVNDFIKDVNNNGADKFNGSLKKSREALNYSYVTPEMGNLIRNNFMSIPENETYKLTAEKKADNTVVVTSIGKTNGFLGKVVEKQNQFLLKEVNGEWKISDSYGLLAFYLNFQIEDTQWGAYWDLKKANILNEIMENVKLEVVNKGYRSYFGDAMKGNLKLINDSNYDIKGIKVLIEHFDKNGVSVNTDNVSVYDVIRSKGYREFDWYTFDCSKCATQTFAIKFVEETIK